jgi:hypothetical protein
MAEQRVEQIVSKIIETLQTDPTLNEEQREDGLSEIEIVSLQLNAAERNEPLLAWALESLERILSLNSLVKELRTIVTRKFRHHA